MLCCELGVSSKILDGGHKTGQGSVGCHGTQDLRAYNAAIVRRGGILLDFRFLDEWDSELAEIESHKGAKEISLSGDRYSKTLIREKWNTLMKV